MVENDFQYSFSIAFRKNNVKLPIQCTVSCKTHGVRKCISDPGILAYPSIYYITATSMGVPCLCSYPKQNKITKKLNKKKSLKLLHGIQKCHYGISITHNTLIFPFLRIVLMFQCCSTVGCWFSWTWWCSSPSLLPVSSLTNWSLPAGSTLLTSSRRSTPSVRDTL